MQPQSTREVLIIDTDPGIDDLMAIYLALASPSVEVFGLTTVFGNHYIDETTRNALLLLERAGRSDIPVARGAGAPLGKDKFETPATFVHGDDGLGDAGLAEGQPKTSPIEKSAAQFIIDTIMARPGEVTLVPLGPLTNIALAYQQEPKIAHHVKRVVLMGGTMLAPGNVSPVAEANIHNDPAAADVVFRAPWPVVMVGLDVTMQVVMNEAFIARLAQAKNTYTDAISKAVVGYFNFHEEAYGERILHTHDPTAVAYVIDPTLFKVTRHRVRVAVGGIAHGMTVADRRQESPKNMWQGPLVDICVGVDTHRLLDICVGVDTHRLLELYATTVMGATM